MADSENNEFRNAERQWQTGNTEPAIALHRKLAGTARDARVRLQSSIVLIERLRPPEHIQTILESTASGIDAARMVGEEPTQAFVMARRALALVQLNGFDLIRRRKDLKMDPHWIEFSLEGDKAEFQSLTMQIIKNDSEADRLLKDAGDIARRLKSATTRGHVMLCAGQVESGRYLSLKIDLLSAERRYPAFLAHWLRPYGLDDLLLYSKDARQKLRHALQECESYYMASADAFIEAGEDDTAAYAFYNLANDLRTAFRFRKASKHLSRAKALAEKHQDSELLRGVKVLEESIRVRNRDTPNYLAGETRKPFET